MEKQDFGQWRLERLLGSGAFGKVLLLTNQQTGEKIAVKKIHPDSLLSSGNWEKEVNIIHQLNHPGIVSSFPVPKDLEILARDTPILCMEYCSGGDLRQALNKPSHSCGLPEKDVLHILNDISSAVMYLHSVKVVHRDLKPENVVVQVTQEKKIYKLIDLGFAKDLNKDSLCHTMVGTLQYLAPELFTSEKYSNTVDFWSLGVMIHECITGVRPFLPGMPPIQLMKHLERKTRHDICIYSNPDGNVIFSNTLFKENHLNSVMQLLMEDWLKLMLDFNPALRGRRYSDSDHPGPNVAFQTLEGILKAEIVSIFWVEGLSVLSYTVSNDIPIEMIQEWIQRDTSIKPQHQLLLLPRGNELDFSKSARQLLSNEEHGIPCLFSKFNDGSECKLTPKYSELLEIMLTNPRVESEYRMQKRMWAHSIFFIHRQMTLYRKLVHALKVLSTYITVKVAMLKQENDLVNGSLRHVISCHDLFANSLRQDQHNYKLQAQRGGLPSGTLLDKWDNDEITLRNKLIQVKSKYDMLQNLVQRTVSCVCKAGKAAETFLTKPSDVLDKHYQSALELYADLQKRPAEERQRSENHISMVKVVVKVMRSRDQLFTECFSQIRVAEKNLVDLDSFPPQLFELKNELQEFQENIFELQNQRQADIWTLLERAVTLWQCTSMMNQQSLTHPTGEANHLSIGCLSTRESDSHESMAAIQENRSLRYQIQETLGRGLSATCNSVIHRVDYEFLND